MIVLDDLCLNIVDCLHKTAPINELGNYFAVGTPAMRGNSIDYSLARRIDDITFDEWTKRLRPRYGDLLLAREAPVGPVVRIPIEENVAPGQRTVLLRPDTAKVISDYLYYLLIAPEQQERLNQPVGGSTVAHLNVADVRSFRLPDVPPLMEQRRIAEVLGALDDKIESNRRTAVKCYEVANELFHQAASVNRKLDEVSEVRMGVSPPGSSYNETGEGMAFFQGVRDFSFLHPVARVYTNEPKRLAAPGDILFSVRAPVGRLNIADSPCCIGRGLAAITSNRSAICLFALRAAAAEWEKFSAEGTVFGAVNQKSLKSTFIPWPNPLAEQELENQLSLLIAIASQSERESISISKLRDALLPELMSGRMRVDEAGRLVTEALDEEVADV